MGRKRLPRNRSTVTQNSPDPLSASAVRRSATWLVGRQLAGLVLSGGSLLLITHIAGPAQYGIYGGALAIWTTVQTLSEASLDVWLVRRVEDKIVDAYSTAETLLVAGGVLGSGACVGAAFLATTLTEIPAMTSVLIIMAPSVLVVTASQVSLSLLERELRYKTIGKVELSGQAVFAACGVALAAAGWGAKGLATAFVVQQVMVALSFQLGSRRRLVLGWQRDLAKEAARFSLPTTGTAVLGTLKNSLVQIAVGRYLGAEALGVVSLAYRLLDQAAFLRLATLRLSLSVFGQLRADRDRLSRALERGLLLQVLLGSIPALALCWISPWLVSLFFGPEWRSSVALIGYLVPGTVIAYSAAMLNSALAALDLPRVNLIAGAVSFTLGALALVFAVPWLGVPGVALAEGAAVGSWIIMYLVLHQRLAEFTVSGAVIAAMAFSIAAQASNVSYWLALAVFIPFLSASFRGILGGEVSEVGARVRSRKPSKLV